MGFMFLESQGSWVECHRGRVKGIDWVVKVGMMASI